MKAYIDMLGLYQYQSDVLPGESLKGLGLETVLLDNVLSENYRRFRQRQPKETRTSSDIDWTALGVKP
jgi:hypothetical protein